MKIGIKKNGTLAYIGGGKKEQEIIEKLERLEATIEELVAREADTQTLGLVRLTDAQSVTAGRGLALPASQNNAALPGTLAHRIQQNITAAQGMEGRLRVVEEKTGKFKLGTWTGNPGGDTATIREPGAWLAIACNGDINASGDVHVVGTRCESSNIYVKLSKAVNIQIRINYICFL